MYWNQLTAVCLALFSAAECLAGEPLDVRFYNYASVPHATLKGAQRLTDEIFKSVGIHPRWVECPISEADVESRVTCPLPRDSGFVVLQIIPTSRAAVYARPNGELGFATYPDAYIFFDRVQEYCKKHSLAEATVLGAVLAHEAGHLLLGQKSHSSTGLMRAVLEPADFTDGKRVYFTGPQVKRMRAGLQKRGGKNLPGAESSRKARR